MDETIVDQRRSEPLHIRFGRPDAAVLLITAPFLLAAAFFPVWVSVTALILLPLPFLVRLWRGAQPSRPTAANLPVALLALVVLPLAFALSPAPWAISWSRLTTLAWSIALFFTIVNWSPPLGQGDGLRTKLGGPTKAYLAMGVIVAVAGFGGYAQRR
jgi:hypothetical protein